MSVRVKAGIEIVTQSWEPVPPWLLSFFFQFLCKRLPGRNEKVGSYGFHFDIITGIRTRKIGVVVIREYGIRHASRSTVIERTRPFTVPPAALVSRFICLHFFALVLTISFTTGALHDPVWRG